MLALWTAVVTTGALSLVAAPSARAIPPAWDVQINCQEDVVLPGEPGDYYNFVFADTCKDAGRGVFVYVYNKLPDGAGGVTGIGFLAVPSNLADLYNSHTTYYGSSPDPGEWWSSGLLSGGGFPLTPMDAIQLQSTNYVSDALGPQGSVVGAIQFDTSTFAIRWGTAIASSGGSAPPVPTYAITSNPDIRDTCWPTVSSSGGSWVQLTDSGCAPPSDRPGARLLGWATSSNFPVERAQRQVDLGWGAIDETIDGIRMIFIPLNGYTLLTGDNTMSPIWSA